MSTASDRVAEMLQRITLKYPIFGKVTFEAYGLEDDIEIRVFVEDLPHRLNGEPIQGTTYLPLPAHRCEEFAELSDEALRTILIHNVRHLLKTALIHELDEMLHFDDVIVFDPHLKDGL